MSEERWLELMNDDGLSLNQEEITQKWHFCTEWDGLLISPEMDEFNSCTCFKPITPAPP